MQSQAFHSDLSYFSTEPSCYRYPGVRLGGALQRVWNSIIVRVLPQRVQAVRELDTIWDAVLVGVLDVRVRADPNLFSVT
jgi:hypothetical protein